MVAVVEEAAVAGSSTHLIAGRHTARAIVIHDNQLLLMERWRGDLHYFSIPGGGIDPGEIPEETVVREILEETSLDIELVDLVMEMHEGDRVHKVYLCRYISGQPYLPEDSPEFLDMTPDNRFAPCWVPLDQIKDTTFGFWAPLKPALVDFIENGFSGEVKIVTANEAR